MTIQLGLKQGKKKVGRKPLYTEWITEEGLTLVNMWAEDGLIGKQIARNIGINHTTLYDWMNKFPELAEVIRRGRKGMQGGAAIEMANLMKQM